MATKITFKALSDLIPAVNVVPLTSSSYKRTTTRADGAFLLEESLRFFNFGTGPKEPSKPGEAFVQKSFQRITPARFEEALNEFCHDHTEFIYEHITKVYGQLSPKTLPEFSAKWGRTRWM